MKYDATQPVSVSSLLSHATLLASLLAVPAQRDAVAAHNPSGDPSPPPPQFLRETLQSARAPQDPPLFHHENRDLSQHITHLPARVLSTTAAQQLASEGRLKSAPTGVVFDEKHVAFVSWDKQGILFEKSLLNPPRASHSAAVMIRSQIEAHVGQDGAIGHVLRQAATVISFMPDSLHGISEHVRIFPAAFDDPRGVPGKNWQGLDLLFSPNSFIGSPSIKVSASRLIPVTDDLYRAFVLRAHDLDAYQVRYFVLGSQNRNHAVENCLGALKGVSLYLPNPQGLPRTFTLRGQQATDFVAHDMLRRAGIFAPNHAPLSRKEDWMLFDAFIESVPAAKSPRVAWYTLRAEQ